MAVWTREDSRSHLGLVRRLGTESAAWVFIACVMLALAFYVQSVELILPPRSLGGNVFRIIFSAAALLGVCGGKGASAGA